jgi:hypothetical protein
MASIFDQARDILKNIQSGASNIGSSLSNVIPSKTYNYDFRSPPPAANPNVIGDPSKMKLNVGVSPNFVNNMAQSPVPSPSSQPIRPMPTASPIPQPSLQPQAGQWQSKFQSTYDKVVPQKKLSQNDVRVLVTSENGREIPDYQNFNVDPKTGKKLSVDTGLLQINTPLDSPEIAKLKDPEYNINKGLEILRQRNAVLGDPVLAIASYNLGAGGAVLNPKKALERARKIYGNAGVPLPETPFTRDPEGFVSQNMDTYKRYGLFK